MNPHEVKPVWLQCEGKSRFQSGAEANIAIRKKKGRAAMKSGGGARKLESYRCPHCGFWHLGGARKR